MLSRILQLSRLTGRLLLPVCSCGTAPCDILFSGTMYKYVLAYLLELLKDCRRLMTSVQLSIFRHFQQFAQLTTDMLNTMQLSMKPKFIDYIQEFR